MVFFLRAATTPTNKRWGLALWVPTLAFSPPPKTQMNPFSKKREKPLKPSQQAIFPGIITNTAVGPLGFRTELGVGPEGERSRSLSRLEADESDSTVAQGGKNSGGPWIVYQDKKNEDQVLPAPETSNPGVIDGGNEHGNNPTGRCFRPLLL